MNKQKEFIRINKTDFLHRVRTNPVFRKEWAIKKWQWIVDNWDYTIDNNENKDKLIIAIPELGLVSCFCTFCELYLDFNCKGCPLQLKRIGCLEENSYYLIWFKGVRGEKSTIKAKQASKMLLEAIKKL